MTFFCFPPTELEGRKISCFTIRPLTFTLYHAVILKGGERGVVAYVSVFRDKQMLAHSLFGLGTRS
jgi:hypothetical protein